MRVFGADQVVRLRVVSNDNLLIAGRDAFLPADGSDGGDGTDASCESGAEGECSSGHPARSSAASRPRGMPHPCQSPRELYSERLLAFARAIGLDAQIAVRAR